MANWPSFVKKGTGGHAFEWCPTGVIARPKSERSIVFALSGTLFSLYGYRVDSTNIRGNACAALAPEQSPDKSAINSNDFHCAAGHSHEVLLRKNAEQQGIALEGELQECEGAPWRRLFA